MLELLRLRPSWKVRGIRGLHSSIFTARITYATIVNVHLHKETKMFKELETLKELLENQGELTADDFADWKQHPITRLLMNTMKLCYLDASGTALSSESAVTDIRLAELRGNAEVIEQVLDWSPFDEN